MTSITKNGRSRAGSARARLLGMGLVCVAGLAACGGGGGSYSEAPPAPSAIDQIAPGASQTASGLLGYLSALAAVATGTADTKEPLALDGFAPVVSEDTEPAAVTVPGA